MPANDQPEARPDIPTTDRTVGGHPDHVAAVSALSYEQARDELVQVVARLETGGETLEGSLALWERGEALATRCQEWLDGARERLEAARGARSEDEHIDDEREETR